MMETEVINNIVEIELQTEHINQQSIKDIFCDYSNCVFVFETNSWTIDEEDFDNEVKYVIEYEKLEKFKSFIFNELSTKINFYKSLSFKSGLKIYFDTHFLTGSFSIDYLPKGMDFVRNVIIYFTIHKLNNF